MTSESPDIDILYIDDELVVVNKPAGMLVHRSEARTRDRVFLLQTLRNQIGGHVHPVHRLDRPTSGALVFARTGDAASRLGQQIARHEMHKVYLAVVRGRVPDAGTIGRYLGDAGGSAPRFAVTRYRLADAVCIPCPLGKEGRQPYSLVEVHPETGRFHQIRRHLNGISHPILGDSRHGDTRHNAFVRKRVPDLRLMLHAAEIGFRHPETGRGLRIAAPVPVDFQTTMEVMGLDLHALDFPLERREEVGSTRFGHGDPSS